MSEEQLKLFKEKIINIVVEGGCVVDVEGLPEDWEYAITDVDDNPDAWEENEGRMNIIGQNGNDGLHYGEVEDE